MKIISINISVIFLLISSTYSSYATLKRLNNNPGIVADYATIDAAISGQATWDTLYVEPSATTYNIISNSITGNFSGTSFSSAYLNTPNKVIIGNGYLLDPVIINYTPPPLQSNKLESKIGANPFQSTQYVMFGNNITCIGLSFDAKIHEQTTQIPHTIENVKLISCKFNQGVRFMSSGGFGFFTTLNNINIIKCFTQGIEFFGSYNMNNIALENNIIIGTGSSISLNTTSVLLNITIRNNIISNAYSFRGAYCANNIFLDSDTTHFNFTDNNLKNNIFVAPAFSLSAAANAVNNQFNVNPSLLFNPLNIFGGPDGDYYLATSSPAIGAGVPNGATPVDCGAYGGPDPYKLSGIPPFPTIYELSVPAVIPAGTQMNITLSTRSNN